MHVVPSALAFTDLFTILLFYSYITIYLLLYSIPPWRDYISHWLLGRERTYRRTTDNWVLLLYLHHMLLPVGFLVLM